MQPVTLASLMAAAVQFAQAGSSLGIDAVVIAAAASAVWLRSSGRATWRARRDRRRHPARGVRLAATIATVVAGASLVLGMAVTAEPRPLVPRGQIATVRDPGSLTRAATFVLFDPVPGGRRRLDALSSSGASY